MKTAVILTVVALSLAPFVASQVWEDTPRNYDSIDIEVHPGQGAKKVDLFAVHSDAEDDFVVVDDFDVIVGTAHAANGRGPPRPPPANTRAVEAVSAAGVSFVVNIFTGDDAGTDAAGRRLNVLINHFGSRRWANSVMPFKIDSTLSFANAPGAHAYIIGSMWRWMEHTPMRFVAAPDATYTNGAMRFVGGGGCSSYVGRIGGDQAVTLVPYNGVSGSYCAFGSTIHEIMHASGVMHEHTRIDRDSFVQINFENIQAGREGNFNKVSASSYTDILSYDYSSVMHYGAYAFSTNGLPTIEPLQSGVSIGQRVGFSQIDIDTAVQEFSQCYSAPSGSLSLSGSGPTWTTGPWGPCTGTINSEQTRLVFCRDLSTSTANCLADSQCTAPKPATSQSCTLIGASTTDMTISFTGGMAVLDPDFPLVNFRETGFSDSLDWLLWGVESRTSRGVQGGATGGSDDFFILLESTMANENEEAWLSTRGEVSLNTCSVSFKYNTYGTAGQNNNRLELRVCTTSDSACQTLWSAGYSSSSSWVTASVNVGAAWSGAQDTGVLRWVAISGPRNAGDVALDDVVIGAGCFAVAPACTVDADCDDGVYCNGAETCTAGSCAAGTPVQCDDGLFCNGVETCDEANDQCAAGNPVQCDDGLFCNGVETCDEANDQCAEGVAVTCADDGIFCNGDEVCDEFSDTCGHSGRDCSNGIYCDGAEECDPVQDVCVSGAPPVCNDGLFCNGQEVCDETSQSCASAPSGPCGDGLWCNGDETCDEANDQCVAGTPRCADDGLFCNGPESCDEANDQCLAGPAPCVEDGDVCNGVVTCSESSDVCLTAPGPDCVADVKDGCQPAGCSWLNDADFSVCGDGVCTAGEDCDNCSGDCGSTAGAVCGNGVCEAGNGENCVTCPNDCAGKQNGKPNSRFCCGFDDGIVSSPVGCSTSSCGNDCTLTPVVGGPCQCGDGDLTNDDPCTCLLDHGNPPVIEICNNGVDDNCDGDVDCLDAQCSSDPSCVCTPSPAGEDCSNGIDDTCDGAIDCADSACSTDPACVCGGNKASCSSNADCCSGNCGRGRCKGGRR